MIFDYLHSGYSAPAKWRQDSDDTVMIRWYRAAPNALVFPYPHAFGSTAYDEPDEWNFRGPGEQKPSYYEWSTSGPSVPDGQSTPTPPDWFLLGAPASCAAQPCNDATLGVQGSFLKAVDAPEARLQLRASWEPLGATGVVGLKASIVLNPASFSTRLGAGTSFVEPVANFSAELGVEGSFSTTGSTTTACCPGIATPNTLTISFGTSGCAMWNGRALTLGYSSALGYWTSGAVSVGAVHDPIKVVWGCSGGSWSIVVTNSDIPHPTEAVQNGSITGSCNPYSFSGEIEGFGITATCPGVVTPFTVTYP